MPTTSDMPTTTNKDNSIETLRGIAITLMVAGHVIGDDSSAGMRVEDESPLRHFYYSLEFMRMPLFTAISGFVYAMRPLGSPSRVGPFLRGKMRRLLLPMVAVGTLEFLIRSQAPGVNRSVALRDIWRIYVTGFDHFWFLQAVFSVFVVLALLEASRVTKTEWGYGITLAVCCAVSLFLPTTSLFSLNGAAYLLPYMLLGVGLNRFERLRSSWLVFAAACAFALGVGYQQWTWVSSAAALLERTGPVAMVIGVSGMVLFFRFRPSLPLLARLGFYSYAIYLFHVFGTAPARVLAGKLGAPEPVVFLFSLATGLGIPVVIERLVLRSPGLSLLLLGLKPKRAAAAPLGSPAAPVSQLRISRPS